jgi:small subunit ribosomal protein S16
LLDPEEVTVKTERIRHWMEKGATPSATVKTILKKKGFFTVSP